MTITDFKRDIETRECRYACLGDEDKALPVRSIIHISDVIAAEEFPAVIVFTDGINIMELTQIQSIDAFDDRYIITCGAVDELRTSVTVHFCPQCS